MTRRTASGLTLTRRDLLAGAAAATVFPSAQAHVAQVLSAAPTMAQITSQGGPQTPVFAYGGSVPGPTLRVPQGERLKRTFQNGLDQPSTVHWHGIRIDNAMDGVAGLTQDAVAPGASFDYDFVLPDAGTYWYHPHNRTYEQMARGLYGALIVDEPNPPQVDHDIPLMLDDWRLAEDGTIHDSFGHMHDWSHAGRMGNWVTANGDAEWTQSVQTGDRLRLRLINTANARIFRVGLKGLTGWLVALDGQPLPEPVETTGTTLGPSQRADFIVDVPPDVKEGLIYSTERDVDYVVASFPVSGTRRTAALAAPHALPPNPVTSAQGRTADDVVTLDMDGGAMGRMSHAVLNGQKTEIRDLVRQGMAWSFNGIAGMPDTPLLATRIGRTVRMKFVNNTRWPHAIHLHGHHFQEISEAPTLGPLRDTILVDPTQSREVTFVADNPGPWLLHCHMLEHAASGMMTWIDVAA